MLLSLSPKRALKAVGFSSCVALVLGFGSLSHAQNYFTTFDQGEGYSSGYSLSGQNGWLTNDVFNPANIPTPPGPPVTSNGQTIGQTDIVGYVSNYSTNLHDYLGAIGNTSPATQVPGAAVVDVFHPVTLYGTTYALDTDLSVIPSSTAFPNNDTFGFSFGKMGAGSTADIPVYSNSFGVAFVPVLPTNPTGGTGTDLIYYTFNGVNIGNAVGTITMNSRYHLTMSVNVAAGTLTASLQNFVNGMPSGVATPLGTGISVGIAAASGITQASADWVLSTNSQTAPDNGGYVNAGGNYMLFNNFGVAVPEPSTWVMMGIGAMGLAARFRRKARA